MSEERGALEHIWMPLPAPLAPDGGRGLREDKTR
jgi:hypothetical protein